MITQDLAKIYRGVAAATGEQAELKGPPEGMSFPAPGDLVHITTTTGGPCGHRPDHIWQFARELRSYNRTTYEYRCDRCYARHYETGESVRAPARAAKAQQALAANGGGKIVSAQKFWGQAARRDGNVRWRQ